MTINADALNKEETEVRRSERKPLREVTIKIGLERLDTQEGITVEALLDSGATGLVMSSEFARKKGFKVQSNLPYILILMVCANYCAAYPKRP